MTRALLADALREGLRTVGWTAAAGVLLVVVVAPSVGGMALGARARTTVDAVLWVQWLVPQIVALQLGTALLGPVGLRQVVLSGPVSVPRWVALRWGAAAGLLGALVAVMVGAGAAVSAVRGVGLGMAAHGVSVWLEALVWLGLTAWARALGARGWLAALAAATVALAGHVQGELVAAAGTWGLDGVVGVALLAVPGMQRASVEGPLITGLPLDAGAVGWGWLHLLGWSLATAGATVLVMSRRDPV